MNADVIEKRVDKISETINIFEKESAKMKSKLLQALTIGLAMMLVVSFTLVGCAKEEVTPTPAVQPGEVYKVRYQVYYTKGSQTYQWMNEFFAKPLEKMSNGRFEIEQFGAGELLSGGDFLTGTGSGLVELCHDFGGYHTGESNLEFIEMGMPGYICDENDWRFFSYEFGWDDWMQENYFTPANVYKLATTALSSSPLMTTKPVNSLEDLRKLKVRCPGIPGMLMEQLGVSTVMVAFQECYTALASGIIDGMSGPTWDMYHDMKFDEVMKYGLLPYVIEGHASRLIANKDFMDGLPEDLQEIVWVAAHFCASRLYESMGFYSTEGLKAMQDEMGVTVTHIPEEDMPEWKAAQARIIEDLKSRDAITAEACKLVEDYARARGYIE